MRRVKQSVGILIAVLLSCCLSLVPTIVHAQSASTNYKVNESQFGIGGDLSDASANYKAQLSAGTTAGGTTSSTNYTTKGGFLTAREEYLEMVVTPATISLGTLTTASASTGTANFFVRAYTSSGYNVISASQPPTNGARQLAPMTSTAASSPGTEQFGINLVANTSPTTFGANPALQPNGSFAYGAAASGYGTANQFKYNAGDTIATAPKGIGQTNFTISYIANISSLTPGGTYSVDEELIVVANF
jgi:hypothetical protein